MVRVMAHPRNIAPYNADCDTEKEFHICAHISMADDASEMAKLGGDAYLGLVCHRGLIADEPDSTVADSASHVQRRSALAISYITGAGKLPGTMGEVYPVGSFKGLTVLPVNQLDWEKETGHALSKMSLHGGRAPTRPREG
jgi:hypothetical protein